MCNHRSNISSILLLSVGATFAQQQVRINDATAILGHVNISHTPHAIAAMEAAGVDERTIAAAGQFGDPAIWPEVWRSDSARAGQQHILANATAYSICAYAVNEQPLTIIHVPTVENFHLPDAIRAKSDMYMLIRTEALGPVAIAEVQGPSEGPDWRSMPKARITAPAQLYATYDLAQDPDAIQVLKEQGMSQAEIDAVIFRSHERNWPEGIDDLSERLPKLDQFKKFQAYVAARWNDKVLVVIPAELNKKLPASLRPYMDIYMVYTGPAVAVVKK